MLQEFPVHLPACLEKPRKNNCKNIMGRACEALPIYEGGEEIKHFLLLSKITISIFDNESTA